MTGHELATLYDVWRSPAGIRAVRATLGLSQERFAAVLGVSQRAVSHWERGTRTPTIRALVKLSRLVAEWEGRYVGGAVWSTSS